MVKESTRKNISEYEFLRLYAFTIVAQNQSPIIKNHELEKDLFKFYGRPEYRFLFNDIIKKEDILLPENNHVDLSVAFQTAYALGLLTMIQDSGDLRSIINFTPKEAQQMLSQFSEEQIIVMASLCSEYYKLKNPIKENNLIKKRKLSTHVH